MFRTIVSVLFAAAVLVSFVPLALAQGAPDGLAAEAGEAFAASNWAEAARLYGELTTLDDDNTLAWYRLALSTLNGQLDLADAIAAYEKALELGAPPTQVWFGIARAHARSGDDKAAWAALDRLPELGASIAIANRLGNEPDFERYRSKSKFESLVAQMTPCTSEPYRAFDFWVGSWNVTTPQGQQVGTNTISRELDGCMLVEQWESVQGGKGFSINYYDDQKGTWTQTYRDNTGNIAQWPDLVGGLKDGAMVLESSLDVANPTRWTWTKISDDKVRQMAETTPDGGETWQVVWDSYYERVK